MTIRADLLLDDGFAAIRAKMKMYAEQKIQKKKRKRSEVDKAYNKSNKQKRKQSKKAYDESNKEKKKQSKKAYDESNKEKKKQAYKEYHQDNRGSRIQKMRVNNNRRRQEEKKRVAAIRSPSQDDDYNIDVETVQSVENAKQIDQRTIMDGNYERHRAKVCVVCDEIISGTDKVCKIGLEQIEMHRSRLGVESYEAYYGELLRPQANQAVPCGGSPRDTPFAQSYSPR